MRLEQTYRLLRRFLAVGLSCFYMILCSTPVVAQSETDIVKIDPRLVEIIQTVKGRSSVNSKSEPYNLTRDETYLNLIDRMQTAFYSGESIAVNQAIQDFENAYKADASLDLSRIGRLYSVSSELLKRDDVPEAINKAFNSFTDSKNWFEQYLSLFLEAHIHGTMQERQAALQKAELAFSIIPAHSKRQDDLYVTYAKTRITSLIAHLHNLQGNSELALSTSLEYLRLTANNPDSKLEVDLINNLIYSY